MKDLPVVDFSVSQDRIDSIIDHADYHVFPGTTVTVCCLTLKNGFHVIGQSSCVSEKNFNKTKGISLSFEDAKRKLWELEGYLLRDRLANVGKVSSAQAQTPQTKTTGIKP